MASLVIGQSSTLRTKAFAGVLALVVDMVDVPILRGN